MMPSQLPSTPEEIAVYFGCSMEQLERAFPRSRPNPLLQAEAILEDAHGDYQRALEGLPVWEDCYGFDYAKRLEAFLFPGGEA